MDDADYAQEREELIRQRAIDAVRNRESTPRQGGGPVYCEDCGDRVPAKRLAAEPTARRCVLCQTTKEQRRK